MTRSFPVFWRQGCMFVAPSFTHLRITFSNQRIAALPWMLDLWSSHQTDCGNRVFKMNIHLCCHLCYSSLIFRNNPQCTTISFCQCWFSPMFLFADVVFPWFVYADITLETVALHTSDNVALFVTDAPAIWAPTISRLSKSYKSPIFRFFQRTATQHNL
jgi:hypothetical protein